MALRKLEKPSVDQIIDRGGEVSSEKSNEKVWINFTLRIPKSLLDRIDIQLENRIGLSKTAWILEAIQEKLIMDQE